MGNRPSICVIWVIRDLAVHSIVIHAERQHVRNTMQIRTRTTRRRLTVQRIFIVPFIQYSLFVITTYQLIWFIWSITATSVVSPTNMHTFDEASSNRFENDCSESKPIKHYPHKNERNFRESISFILSNTYWDDWGIKLQILYVQSEIIHIQISVLRCWWERFHTFIRFKELNAMFVCNQDMDFPFCTCLENTDF